MSSKEKMGSRELGLVLTQQILGVDDLHYGLWDGDLELKLSNIAIAQQRYTDNLISAMPDPKSGDIRVFDIGCGTGHVLGQLLSKGYFADGLVPAPSLAKLVRKQQAKYPQVPSKLYECTFEEVPVAEMPHKYDVCLFSESYQYISMDASFEILKKILKPNGVVVICDFFKTEHHGDGKPGDGSFGGGHAMAEFYERVKKSGFEIIRDDDITKRVSPNLQLVNDILHNTIKPVGLTFDRYLSENYPKIYWVIKKLMRKKLDRMNYKYFEGHRSKEVFERYKTYHLIVMKLK